ncbi:putative polyketide synthase 1 [Branchiostoma floridae x Branchiostoma japonicum]
MAAQPFKEAEAGKTVVQDAIALLHEKQPKPSSAPSHTKNRAQATNAAKTQNPPAAKTEFEVGVQNGPHSSDGIRISGGHLNVPKTSPDMYEDGAEHGSHGKQNHRHPNYFPVAIVGIGCRMPGGTTSPEKFWDVISEGRNVITEVPPERWSLDVYHSTDPHQSGTHVTRRAGFVDGIDMFDHTFFKISPREAAMMDPQQRHLLEVSYETFEDAGIVPEKVLESCGVFVGIGMSDYAMGLSPDRHLFNSYANTGLEHSLAANRISYVFNLKGPSLTVDTACASSMTALHLACSSLCNSECNIALVGGCNILLSPEITVGFSAMGVLSPDGRSCPFDASANGYVRSEGFGAILVKPLEDAIRDGDHVYSVIKGSGIADNGFSQSITMPSSSAQEVLMKNTFARFGVPLSSISYIEAHGTSTPVGDPAEAQAIGKTFGPHLLSPLKIGSSKSNFGHMECASGIVGVIKTALMMDRRILCPSINFTSPNPEVDFEALNLRAQTQLEPFLTSEKKMTAGVNSFGFGGALAHVIMEEHRAVPTKRHPSRRRSGWQFGPNDEKGKYVILPLSAKTQDSLTDLAKKWLEFQDEKDAACVASWASTRRTHHQTRLAVIANSGACIRQSLHCYVNKTATLDIVSGEVKTPYPKVCFVFPGQGQQWNDMGRVLYQMEPVFRDAVDTCDSIFESISGWSLLKKYGLFVETGGAGVHVRLTLDKFRVSQPAILFMQVGLYVLLKHWGVQPDVVLGHSLGEIAAAHACGGLTLKEAVRAIYVRSMEQEKLEGTGRMAAVRSSLVEAEQLVARVPGVHVACDNSPTSVTIAGSTEAVQALQDENPTKMKLLRVSCAFHTDHMDPLRESFFMAMSSFQPERDGNVHVPFYSTVTGQRYTGQFDASYWWNNIRENVKFTSATRSLIRDHNPDIYIELGASATLMPAVAQTLKHDNHPVKVTVPCGQRENNDRRCLLRAVGTLYAHGVDINWSNVTPGAAAWTPIPTYAWQHQRHWQEAESSRKRRLGLENRTFKGQNGNISLDMFPFLADHVVNGKVMFPGAAYVEYIAQSTFGALENPCLENVSFKQVLVWPEVRDVGKDKATLQLAVKRDGKKVEILTDRVHAESYVAKEERCSSLSVSDIEMSKILETVKSTTFYQRLDDLGLQYGPSFQVVDKAVIGDWEAVGYLRPANDTQQRTQTTLLDGCFQVAIAAIGPSSTLYLPTGIANFNMYVPSLPLGEPLVAHARIIDCDSLFFKADIAMTTAQGKVLTRIVGFEARGVQSTGTDVEPESCLYETKWQPINSYLRKTDIFYNIFDANHLRRQFRNEMEVIEAVEKIIPRLKCVTVSYIRRALTTVPQHEISPKNARYVERLKQIITEESSVEILPLDEVHALLDEMRRNVPAFEFDLNTLQRLGDLLPMALRDPSAVAPVLFAEGVLAEYFMHSQSIKIYYQACAEAVEKAVKTALTRKQIVRILEIGGRSCGLAQTLLKNVKNHADSGSLEYVFTGLNATFFAQASQALQDFPFVKYKELDIEKTVRTQNFVPGTFDIVICTDTLHTSVDAMAGLKNVQSLLSPDGWLVMLEPTNTFYMVEVMFGSLELCWVYNDKYRRNSCWLSQNEWCDLFVNGGMCDVVGVSSPGEFFHSAIVGRKAEPLAANATLSQHPNNEDKWILVGEQDSPISNALQGILPKDTLVCHIGDRIDIPTQGPRLKVVYIWPENDTNLKHALALTKSLSAASERVHCMWVFTVGGSVDSSRPASSVVTGFFRVVNNELKNLPIYTVDLPFKTCASGLGELASTVATLLSEPPAERELAVRNGGVLVPRLIRTSLSKSTNPTTSCHRWVLDASLDKTRTVEDVEFYELPPASLSSDHVRVQVRAAGLNFKDVMMAYGLLGGLTLQPQFGLECSETVVEVGSFVEHVKVGDEVIAFGDHCFASHVDCHKRFVVKKPSNVTWAEAAGFSMVFMTAYYALVERAGLVRDQSVLIHSACGGVGQAAIQMARLVGARIFCTAGSEEKRNFLRQELGIAHVSDSRSSRFYHDVLQWTGGEGVDVCLSSLYGDLQTTTLKVLSQGGILCEIGKRSMLENAKMDTGPLLENKNFLSVQLDLLMKRNPTKVQTLMKTVCNLLEDGEIQPVKTTVKHIGDYKGTLRWMSTGQHIGKVVFEVPPEFRPERLNPPRQSFDAHGLYLITGGFGGIGQALARWMVDHGARHIALLSRSGCKTAKNRRTVAYMESRGAKVHALTVDVTNRTSLEKTLNHLRENPLIPALKGIFHLAAVIDDSNVLHVSESQLERALAAKAKGALNLHELTQGDQLDIFFLLSSVAATWGNPEQCGYVAANSFLDALAEHRHRQGLPALSVQLDAVRGVGFLEGKKKATEIVKRKGFLTLHINDFLRLMPRLLQARDIAVIALANTDWCRTMQFSYPSTMKYRHLVHEQRNSADSVRSADDLSGQLLDHLGQILGMPPDQIDLDQPMVNYGVDSLMAIDIVNWTNKTFNHSVSQLDILSGMTANTLVGKITN